MIEITETKDGSITLYNPEMDDHYHSIHGAVQEAVHVFIKQGLKQFKKKKLAVFEVGFGTGLNAWLTFFEKAADCTIAYNSIDSRPLEDKLVKKLNFASIKRYKGGKTIFNDMHEAPWNSNIEISPTFNLHKIETRLETFIIQPEAYDLIYFDAFAPDKQPELWEADIFKRMHKMLKPKGLLVTYCAKGQVRRNMEKAGFEVERLPGPPGKREMLRALKKV